MQFSWEPLTGIRPPIISRIAGWFLPANRKRIPSVIKYACVCTSHTNKSREPDRIARLYCIARVYLRPDSSRRQQQQQLLQLLHYSQLFPSSSRGLELLDALIESNPYVKKSQRRIRSATYCRFHVQRIHFVSPVHHFTISPIYQISILPNVNFFRMCHIHH